VSRRNWYIVAALVVLVLLFRRKGSPSTPRVNVDAITAEEPEIIYEGPG
jgi:hypothetical protein